MDKQQVIDTYIEKNNNKSILGFLGINKMLGIDKAIKQYLNWENKPDITSTENFWDFIKWNILINFFLKDKKNELDKLKEYLDLNKDNKNQLESLANEIKKWTEIEKAIIVPVPVTVVTTSNTEVPTVINSEVKTIRNSIEINWDFAYIKEVKNADWKVILECTEKTETPYIHVDALDDILWFAQEFFQKTWKPLTLNSAYRTIENQKKLKTKKWNQAATPWESGHNLWLSIDIEWWDRYDREIGGIDWMRRLAEKYNFLPLSSEDRHFDHRNLPNPGSRLAQAKTLDKDFQERKLA